MISLSIFNFTFPVGPYKASIEMVVLWIFIFAIGYVISKVIKKFLKKYLNTTNIRIQGKKIMVLKILSQVLFAVTFVVAFQVFRLENDNISLPGFIKYKIVGNAYSSPGSFVISIADILIIILIFFIARFSLNLFRFFITRRFKNREDFDEGTEYVYVQLAKYLIYAAAILLSIRVITSDLTTLLVSTGTIFLGIGLALQDIFKDVFSGLVLLFEGTIKVGDVIEIMDTNTQQPLVAKVLRINIRTTKIETRDGNVFIIPNSKLTQENVENWSFGSELTRFDITLGVAYGSNTETVNQLLRQAALSHPKVKKTQPVLVKFENFGESSLEFSLSFWADQSWEIEVYKSDIRFEIDRLFREHKIEIPFPQRVVTMKS